MAHMTARYAGTCSKTGRAIRPGDTIDYDRRTRRAVLVTSHADRAVADDHDRLDPLDPNDGVYLRDRTRAAGYVSNVFNIGGKEYYRNKRGTCEDAPCCGCCTI